MTSSGLQVQKVMYQRGTLVTPVTCSLQQRCSDDNHMIDPKTMRSLLENMERAAEESLQRDAAFCEALQALKSEIDSDPRVQSAAAELRAAGQRVFSSFVPHIKIRVKTEDGIVALPDAAEVAAKPEVEQVRSLTQELRNAASAVIVKSRYRTELDNIVNEAVGASDLFEGIASQIERAGYEVVICLDLSAYAQIRESTPAPLCRRETKSLPPGTQLLNTMLSAHDRSFLKAMGVSTDESEGR